MKEVKTLSPMEQAAKEVSAEECKKAVSAFKEKFKALATAKKIVSNIEREIEDLEQQVKDGNL